MKTKPQVIVPRFTLVFIVTLFWITLDQITKIYVHSTFAIGESVTVVPSFFNITFVRNFGAAFGFLATSHPIFRGIILFSAPVIAAIAILIIIKNEKYETSYPTIALSSILGGALGNFFDRVRFGFVVDYLDFHLSGKWSWPAFNFADVAIVLGVGYLLNSTFLKSKNVKSLS